MDVMELFCFWELNETLQAVLPINIIINNNCFLNQILFSIVLAPQQKHSSNRKCGCLLEEAAEVLAAAVRPGEDTVVTG